MRNDVWLHGRAGRGPKMDVVENKRENETLTETDVKQTKHTHYVQDKAAKVVTGCNGPVCAQHGCEQDVIGTAMASRASRAGNIMEAKFGPKMEHCGHSSARHIR